MKINFITVSNNMTASYRYHNEIPARVLGRLGHYVTISPFPLTWDCDVVVFSKHFNHGDICYLEWCKSKGIKTVFHVCDHHFNTSEEQHYRTMIEGADVVVSSTEELASVIKIETGRNATVIYDPYEFDETEPEFNPEGPLKLLWFGHPTNLKALFDNWKAVEGHSVMIVSDPSVNGKIKLGGKPIPIVPYSKENLQKAMSQCDAVIIPSELGERQRTKSPNRLVESIRRGKFVIADPLPSYQDFDKWCLIGDIKEGLDFVLTQPRESITERISSAQRYIRENHSPEKIGKEWEAVIGK